MREGRVRLIAVAASVAMHAIWFVQSGGVPGAKQAEMPARTTVTRLTFAAPEPIARPAPVALQEPVMEPLPKLEPVASNPKPIPVKKPKPVKKKQPVLMAKRESKPVIKEIEKPSMPVEPVQVASAPAAAAPPAMAAAAPAIDKGLLEQELQRYLADLMAHIEKHKWYPTTARRRGIQGEVRITFLLMADGSIRHLEVEEGPKVLRVAAEQAVAKAEPMPMPPTAIDCPLPCEFSMRFTLN
jgi:protein TonB